MIRAEDLPKALRDRLGVDAAAKSTRPSRAGVGHAADCPGVCGCGHPSPSYSAHERHLKQSHPTGTATRWSITLEVS